MTPMATAQIFDCWHIPTKCFFDCSLISDHREVWLLWHPAKTKTEGNFSIYAINWPSRWEVR